MKTSHKPIFTARKTIGISPIFRLKILLGIWTHAHFFLRVFEAKDAWLETGARQWEAIPRPR